MDRFNRLRRSPYFASLFAHVHPLFWPVLYWSLGRLFAWAERTGYVNVLYEASWCSLIRIVHLGDTRPAPDAWQPYELTKPRWDNPVWSTGVPLQAAGLSDQDQQSHATAQQRDGGGSPLRFHPPPQHQLAVIPVSPQAKTQALGPHTLRFYPIRKIKSFHRPADPQRQGRVRHL